MTEIKHTPGPWEIVPHAHGWVAPAGQSMDRGVAQVRGWGWLQYIENGAEIQDANARLIAAAPEMLDALYDVEATAIDAYDPAMLAKVQAAIAKAEGRS